MSPMSEEETMVGATPAPAKPKSKKKAPAKKAAKKAPAKKAAKKPAKKAKSG